MTEHTTTIIPFANVPQKAEAMDLVGSDQVTSGPVDEKLQDALTPGYQAEFDPAEAEAAGAFEEDALSEADALASSHDMQYVTEGVPQEPTILFAPTRSGMSVGLVLPAAAQGTINFQKAKE